MRRAWHRLFGHGFYVISDLKCAVRCKCGEYTEPTGLWGAKPSGYRVEIYTGWRVRRQ